MEQFYKRQINGGIVEETYDQFGTFNLWKERDVLIRRLYYSSKTKLEERDDFWKLVFSNDMMTLEELTGENYPFLQQELQKT